MRASANGAIAPAGGGPVKHLAGRYTVGGLNIESEEASA